MGAWILWTELAAAGGLGCDRSFDTSDLAAAVETAEAQFKQRQAAGVHEAAGDVLLRLRCQQDRLDPDLIARVHEVMAIEAFLQKETARIPQALAGMGAAAPLQQLPIDLIPEGHPVREAMGPAGRLLREVDAMALPKMASGWVEADGASVQGVPTARATLVQQLDGQGVVVASAYLWPGDDALGWMGPIVSAPTPVAPPPVVRVEKVSHGAPKSTKSAHPSAARHIAFGVGTGVALVGTGVLLALAEGNRAEFDAQEVLPGTATAEERASYRTNVLEPLQEKGTALTVGWAAAAALSAGLGLTMVVTW